MNIKHSLQRLLGLHPLRREGEENFHTKDEVILAIRRDLYVRRHDDTVDEKVAKRLMPQER